MKILNNYNDFFLFWGCKLDCHNFCGIGGFCQCGKCVPCPCYHETPDPDPESESEPEPEPSSLCPNGCVCNPCKQSFKIKENVKKLSFKNDNWQEFFNLYQIFLLVPNKSKLECSALTVTSTQVWHLWLGWALAQKC